MKDLSIKKLLILVLLFSVEGISSDVQAGQNFRVSIPTPIYNGVRTVAGFFKPIEWAVILWVTMTMTCILKLLAEYRQHERNTALLGQHERNTALLVTVVDNDWTTLEKVKELVKAKANVCIKNTHNRSILSLASEFNPPNVVKELLAGATIIDENCVNEALLVTVRKNDWTTLKKVKMLVEADADINARNENGNSSLMLACNNCHPDIVEALLEGKSSANGSNIDTKARWGSTALLTTIIKNDWTTPKKVKALIKAKADINARNRRGDSALILACEKCNLGAVEILLVRMFTVDKNSSTRSIDLRNNSGNTALNCLLHYLFRNTKTSFEDTKKLPSTKKIISLLVTASADVNAQNNEGYSPMTSAIGSFNSVGKVEKLLETNSYIDFKQRNINSKTVLELSKDMVEINPDSAQILKMHSQLKKREKTDRKKAYTASKSIITLPQNIEELLFSFVHAESELLNSLST